MIKISKTWKYGGDEGALISQQNGKQIMPYFMDQRKI